jgi:hypothetical protein
MKSKIALWLGLVTAAGLPLFSAGANSAPVVPVIDAQVTNGLETNRLNQFQHQFQHPPVLLEVGAMKSRAGGQYYITLNVPPEAGASLAGVVINLKDQSAPERPLQFDLDDTIAFLGTSQNPSTEVDLETVEQMDSDVQITFVQPIPPDTTLTIGLKPSQVPNSRHSYQFGVTAFSVAAQPSPVFLGNREISFGRDWDQQYPVWWSQDDIFPFYNETDRRVLFWDLPPEFDLRTRRRAN